MYSVLNNEEPLLILHTAEYHGWSSIIEGYISNQLLFCLIDNRRIETKSIFDLICFSEMNVVFLSSTGGVCV